ncbi:MAG: PASTA domain-containing protein [Prevotella sp.]|nr:PASTA domain-containing protein [Prevotella sp.]
MKIKEFFGKFCSLYLWWNLLAMGLVIVGLCFGLKYGLEVYTHHGEGIELPDMVKMSSDNARLLLEEKGLEMVVTDSGYNKRLPAHCILAQSPGPGTKVKSGHVVYVTINSPSSPSFPIPDVIDNSSYREAEAKLQALGFKLLPPKRILGEKDWVYGILSHGRQLNTGDRVTIDTPLTLLIGNGHFGDFEDIDYTDPDMMNMEDRLGMEDEFEETTESDGNTVVDDSGLSDF